MHEVRLAHEADFSGWRTAARDLAERSIPPSQVLWGVDRSAGGVGSPASLFGDGPDTRNGGRAPDRPRVRLRVPLSFLDMARHVVLHRDASRFALLYALIFRYARGEADLLEREFDPDLTRARRMEMAVGRDIHRMHSLVRFRRTRTDHLVAWFTPDHHSVMAAAPFFAKRLGRRTFSLLTPSGSAHWDGATFARGPGARREQAPPADRMEDLWRAYYAAAFNAARPKPACLRGHIPEKYWHLLPEAQEIPRLEREAARLAREGGRNAQAGQPGQIEQCAGTGQTCPPASRDARVVVRGKAGGPLAMDPSRAPGQPAETPAKRSQQLVAQLAAQAAACQRCDLWRLASQTVFGEGPATARIMLVGEQPGDVEDREGRPFVGPAGHMLDTALAKAGLNRETLYVTNAVKHFKHVLKGNRRLHRSPDTEEIAACQHWLEQELELVQPRSVVAMGTTAARSLVGRSVTISGVRGEPLELEPGRRLIVTVHPSYLIRLRSVDRERYEAEFDAFVADLALGARLGAAE